MGVRAGHMTKRQESGSTLFEADDYLCAGMPCLDITDGIGGAT